jgi:hypothetical protein
MGKGHRDMRNITFAVAAASIYGALSMPTATQAAGLAADLHAGTLGYGLGATLQVFDGLNARLGFNTARFSDDLTESDIDYDVDLEWDTFYALADWHVFYRSFRVTAGLMRNGNQLEGVASSSGELEIGGVRYTSEQVGELKASVEFDEVAPYFGVGWGNAFNRGSRVRFNLDLGVLLQDSAKASLTQVGGAETVDRGDLDREERELEDDLDEFELYPVISLGVGYRF